MPRGGKRKGAGSKPTWIHGKTKTIRVPESLSEKIVGLARVLDEGGIIEDVTKSKYIDLSGIRITLFQGKPAVLIEDLLSAGFKVRPLKLSDTVRKEIDKRKT
jgi:hypothetical protein